MRTGLQPDATPEEVRDQLSWTRGELASARHTIQHMCRSMGWIAGHDRQGLDHLDEAMRAARARERAVEQARAWAQRAKAADSTIDKVRALCDQLREMPGERWLADRLDAILDPPQPPSCARCKDRGYVPDWTNWNQAYGEPHPKPCPDCQNKEQS